MFCRECGAHLYEVDGPGNILRMGGHDPMCPVVDNVTQFARGTGPGSVSRVAEAAAKRHARDRALRSKLTPLEREGGYDLDALFAGRKVLGPTGPYRLRHHPNASIARRHRR